jgi:hypothetical protein
MVQLTAKFLRMMRIPSMMRKLYKAKKCPVSVVDLAKKKKNVL